LLDSLLQEIRINSFRDISHNNFKKLSV